MRLNKLWFLTLALVLYPSLAATAPQTKTSTPAAQSAPTTKPATTAKADAESEASAAKLPVRRVVLYKTGVGYFEHSGQVRGNQSVEVDFTSSQLNDVLQSLTVLDLSGGRIAGVNYNSEAPLSQRLGMLRLPLDEKNGSFEVLRRVTRRAPGSPRQRRHNYRPLAEHRTKDAPERRDDFRC
jgi:hypothetical protein